MDLKVENVGQANLFLQALFWTTEANKGHDEVLVQPV